MNFPFKYQATSGPVHVNSTVTPGATVMTPPLTPVHGNVLNSAFTICGTFLPSLATCANRISLNVTRVCNRLRCRKLTSQQQSQRDDEPGGSRCVHSNQTVTAEISSWQCIRSKSFRSCAATLFPSWEGGVWARDYSTVYPLRWWCCVKLHGGGLFAVETSLSMRSTTLSCWSAINTLQTDTQDQSNRYSMCK